MAEPALEAIRAPDGLSRLAWRLGQLRGLRRSAVGALLGVSAALALPPLYLIPLLWPAFSGLLWLLDGAGRRRDAFLVGWSFGFGYFAAGVYWVGIAFLVDAARFAAVMPLAVAGLASGLAIFPGLATLVVWSIGGRALARVAALAGAWLAMEWLRSWIFTGLPWNLIGTVWAVSTPMMQLAAVTGVWGLSWVTVLAAAAPAAVPELLARPGGSRPWVLPWWPTLTGLLVLGLIAAGGTWRLAAAPAPGSDTVTGIVLRLVQPRIDQKTKWQPALRARHLADQIDLTLSPGFERVSHVIWPETAVPFFLAEEPLLREALKQAVPAAGFLLTGAPRLGAGTDAGSGVAAGSDSNLAGRRLWNSLHAVDSQGRIAATYDKHHLVPFGEYMPLGWLFGFTKLTAGRTDFSAGPGPGRLDLPGLPPASPLICYEVIFPGQVVGPGERPGWLLNLTNDSWFGASSGPYQHLASARLRAVEEGLPLVRSANSGISAVFDGYGRRLASLGLNRRGVLDAPLPRPVVNIPPYAVLGNWLVLMLGTLSIIGVLFCLPLGRICREYQATKKASMHNFWHMTV